MSENTTKPHGSGHWLAQRLTAVAMIPPVLWLIYSIITLSGAPYQEIVAWLSSPINAIIISFFMIVSCLHASLGSQVIAEDYIHCSVMLKAKLILQKIFFLLICVVSLYAIYQIYSV